MTADTILSQADPEAILGPGPGARRARSRLRQSVYPATGITLRPPNPFDKALDDTAALRLFFRTATPKQAQDTFAHAAANRH